MRMTKALWAGVLYSVFEMALCLYGQEKPSTDPVFPFGAVYSRKSNPPEQDWERGHKTAAQLGVNGRLRGRKVEEPNRTLAEALQIDGLEAA